MVSYRKMNWISRDEPTVMLPEPSPQDNGTMGRVCVRTPVVVEMGQMLV